MSEKLAHYSFIPWLRQGVGIKIPEKDSLGQDPAGNMIKERAELAVILKLEDTAIDNAATNESDISKTIKVVGPGDIIGISHDAIVRTEPKKALNKFESNVLVYIEFYEEDFLWRYTPASPYKIGLNAHKLTPWLALIVLKEEEFTFRVQSDGPSFITINSDYANDVFHDEKTLWAWAHVHMNNEMSASTPDGQINEVTSELHQNPDIGVSRLVCPRKLMKETAYQAFLIPAFETGRVAGLKEDPSGIFAQQLSWKKGNMPVSDIKPLDFPFYYTWKFKTGMYGDFETLASILKPTVTAPEMGKQPMDIEEPGFGLDGKANSTILGLEGALKPPGFVSNTWTNGAGDVDFKEHLRNILNLSIDYQGNSLDQNSLPSNPFYSSPVEEDPIVTPHIYGRWHALVTRLQNGATNYHPWISMLNLDPRNRAVAGLGSKTVQENQKKFVKSAWQQIGHVNDVNKKIREAELSKMVTHSIYKKIILKSDTDKTVTLTTPMHKFIIGTDKTINYEIAGSHIPNASKSAAFRRIIRPGKKSNKKLNALTLSDKPSIHKQVITNFNREEREENAIAAAKLKVAPDMSINSGDVSDAIVYSNNEYNTNINNLAQQNLFNILEGEDFSALNQDALKAKVDSSLSYEVVSKIRDMIDNIIHSEIDGDFSVATINTDTFKAIFGNGVTGKAQNNIIVRRNIEAGEKEFITFSTTIADIQDYGNKFSAFNEILNDLPPLTVLPLLADLNNYSNTITGKLAPKTTITNRVASRIKIWSKTDGKFKNIEKLKPVMAYPEFSDAVFIYLKKISQSFIIPNIDRIPENSITLLESNQSFIEAYMSGLNHEMARELLWREYPTDQRGTYFRQFWNIKDNVLEEDPEKKYDVTAMVTWKNNLGEHSNRKSEEGEDKNYLVLVIKGELLQKYPNTMVYAQESQFDGGDAEAPRVLPDPIDSGNIKFPLFQAELEPDIAIFGFDLEMDEAKGDRESAAPKPGWFFVLKERPGQIRFGLDDYVPINPGDSDLPVGNPETWNNLSWEHLVNNKSDLNAYHINFSKSIEVINPSVDEPNPEWGKNSADMASILLQNPVLFARHAQEMLPDD